MTTLITAAKETINVQENNRFKTVNFFGFYVFEDVKELLYH